MTVQHSLHRGSHGSSSVDVHTEKEHHKESQKEQKENKEQGSGRPRAGSESSRNPVSKVMDLIRHRSHSALSGQAESGKKRSSTIHRRHAKRQWSHYTCLSVSKLYPTREISLIMSHERLVIGFPFVCREIWI